MPVDDPIFDSTALEYGADADYEVQTDAYDNTPVKVEPSAGLIAQGLRPERQLAAQYHNWIMRQFALIQLALIGNAVEHETRLDDDEADIADHETRILTLENYVDEHTPRIKVYPYLTSGTFGPGGTHTPAGRVLASFAAGCGGGGSGGEGKNGEATADRWVAGAGGGGGSLFSFAPILGVDPSVSLLNVDIGAGGVPPAVAGSTGGAGGDSIVRLGATQLAAFGGAQGGRGSVGPYAIVNILHYSFGGFSRKDIPVLLIGPAGQGIRDVSLVTLLGETLYFPMQPGQGGYGAGGSTNPVSSPGSPNPFGNFPGGLAGLKGDDGDPNAPPGDLTQRGGGGGGGGGAGPFGPGGAGGRGGAGQAVYGAAGSAAANSGAGGGGGGSSAFNNGSSGRSAAGAGGTGRVYIITVEETA